MEQRRGGPGPTKATFVVKRDIRMVTSPKLRCSAGREVRQSPSRRLLHICMHGRGRQPAPGNGKANGGIPHVPLPRPRSKLCILYTVHRTAPCTCVPDARCCLGTWSVRAADMVAPVGPRSRAAVSSLGRPGAKPPVCARVGRGCCESCRMRVHAFFLYVLPKYHKARMKMQP